MQSGLDFDDTYSLRLKHFKRLNAMAKLNYGHNMMKQIRGLKFRCEPGKEYYYESMTSEILGVIIERATGRRYADYLSEKVWKPLQMESPAIINIDSRKHDVAHAFGGISCTMLILRRLAVFTLTVECGMVSASSVKNGYASPPTMQPTMTAIMSIGTT